MNALAMRCRRYLTYTATTNGRTESIAVQHRLAVWVLLAVLAALAMPASGQTTFQTDVVNKAAVSGWFGPNNAVISSRICSAIASPPCLHVNVTEAWPDYRVR